jgi:uncharacterized heparinase superfamily protein
MAILRDRNSVDHVSMTAGPLGPRRAWRHGHNDFLAFEACSNGELLIVDCGSYLYTASLRTRNAFRSDCRSHNTPRVDDEEINRFIAPSISGISIAMLSAGARVA